MPYWLEVGDLIRVNLPMLAILAVAGAGMGYFSRFKENPLQLPYSFYRSTVTMAPHFIWQSPRPQPVYRHSRTAPVLYRLGNGGVLALLSMAPAWCGRARWTPLAIGCYCAISRTVARG